MLTDAMIMDKVINSSFYARGINYFLSGAVKNLTYNPELNRFEAIVNGHDIYHVRVDFDEKNDIQYYKCTCPAHRSYSGACKHTVAVLKTIQSSWNKFYTTIDLKLSESVRSLFQFLNTQNFLDSDQNQLNGKVNTRIIPHLHFFIMPKSKIRTYLKFQVGDETLYIMKNVKTFVESSINKNTIYYGKKYIYTPKEAIYDHKSKQLLRFLQDVFLDDKYSSQWKHFSPLHYSGYQDDSSIKVPSSSLQKFLEIYKDHPFHTYINSQLCDGCKLIQDRPNIIMDISSIQGGIKITSNIDNNFHILNEKIGLIYFKGDLYKADLLFTKCLSYLYCCFTTSPNENEIIIPNSEATMFFSSILPKLQEVVKLRVNTSIEQSIYREELFIDTYFDKYYEGISVRVSLKYGEHEINPLGSNHDNHYLKDGKVLFRILEKENNLLELLEKYGFKPSKEIFTLMDDDKIFNFLFEGLNEIKDVSDVYYSDDFKNININTRVSAGIRIKPETGMLEMSLEYDDLDPQELLDLLASYRHKKRYHKLKSGSFISLDSSEFQVAAELINHLNINESDISKKVIEFPKHMAMYIDSFAREKPQFKLERSNNFKRMVQDISEPQDMEFKIPDGINGKLRDYQKIGYKWLKTLAHYGLGGILADDMGLGKTLQVITMIKSENVFKTAPSLVIAPTSLIYNWQEEVNKFAPDLSVIIISGSQIQRRELFDAIENSDIVVTTYGMLKKDIELYEKYKFKFCFIDEAQHIKNPKTLNAKSVKQIKADCCFAITGTPIENTLTELWSIFDFLMPGYLLSHNKFISKYETPIIKNSNKEALVELGRHIKPFILRRLKKDVLKELPEKIESKMANEMTIEQRKVYAAYLSIAKKEFEEEILERGFENSQIKILSLLTRMRQICCHPGLFIENYKGGSGKFEMLFEILEDAIDGDHRILVFSQFTSMLSLIKEELENKKIKYYYLDGSTTAEDRIKLVNSFNYGEKDVFLISLKAGGTGLNLTGADMVIHYDPWWNPAVEDQATDRAHRIGQEKVVQVFKLITKNTIEEKIFQLQQKKKELINAVIKPGENFLTKMTEEEIRDLFVT